MDNLVIQILPLIFWLILAVVPSVYILRRAGMHPALAAFNLLPFLGTVVLLWIIAFSKWPKINRTFRLLSLSSIV